MTPHERLFDFNYHKELLKIAEGDLESAKSLNKSKQGRLENIFFLAEQAIEKALKAVLCHQKKPVPFSHDLGLLVGLLNTTPGIPFSRELPDLTQHATVRRYEEGNYQPTLQECEGILTISQEVLDWAKRICK